MKPRCGVLQTHSNCGSIRVETRSLKQSRDRKCQTGMDRTAATSCWVGRPPPCCAARPPWPHPTPARPCLLCQHRCRAERLQDRPGFPVAGPGPWPVCPAGRSAMLLAGSAHQMPVCGLQRSVHYQDRHTNFKRLCGGCVRGTVAAWPDCAAPGAAHLYHRRLYRELHPG